MNLDRKSVKKEGSSSCLVSGASAHCSAAGLPREVVASVYPDGAKSAWL